MGFWLISAKNHENVGFRWDGSPWHGEQDIFLVESEKTSSTYPKSAGVGDFCFSWCFQIQALPGKIAHPVRSLQFIQKDSWWFRNAHLVDGAITILKNMSSSMGRMTSHIWNGKYCLKPPTSIMYNCITNKHTWTIVIIQQERSA